MNYNLENMTPKDLEKLIVFLQNLLGVKVIDKTTISKVISQELISLGCPYCGNNENIIKNGFTENKIQRYKCKKCNKRFISSTNTPCYHSKVCFRDWLILHAIIVKFVLEIG